MKSEIEKERRDYNKTATGWKLWKNRIRCNCRKTPKKPRKKPSDDAYALDEKSLPWRP